MTKAFAAMRQVSISRQIRFIATVLLAAIAIGSVISILSSILLGNSVAGFKKTTTEASMASNMLENLLEARLSALSYRFAHSEESEGELHARDRAVVDALEEIEAMLSEDDPMQTTLGEIRAGVESYEGTFDRTTEKQAVRDALVAELEETGPQVRKMLSEIMESAFADRDPEAAFHAGVVQQHLMLGRLYGERFSLTNDKAALDRAGEELEASRQALTTLIGELQNPARLAQAKDVEEGVDRFGALLEQTAETIFARNALRLDLDATGEALQVQVERLLKQIRAEQDALGQRSDLIVTWTLILVVFVALTSVVAGLAISTRMRRSIDTQLESSLGTMADLADGQLDVEIEGVGDETELGRIARSLLRFRDNAVEARDLERQKRERDEAQQKRDALEEERRQAAEAEAAARIEAARRKMLEDLGQSVGSVVEAGANGDFSRRIEVAFDDPELNEMADLINRLVSSVEDGVNATARIMSRIAGGDLTRRMDQRFNGKFGELAGSVNDTVENLSCLVTRISEQCVDVAEVAQSLTAQTTELARRAEAQAASLEQTSAAMEEISVSVKSSAQNSSSASERASSTAIKVGDAGKVVETAVGAMGDISSASAKINEIVSVIDGIAFQTNLLALNAGVEAARAGDAGRGFAVVASEVRALAQRSSEASHDIKSLIEESSTQVDKGVEIVEETGRTLSDIIGEVEVVANLIAELNGTATEQAAGINEVTEAITQLDGITQQNAIVADQSNHSLTELQTKADRMLELLASFTTGDGQPAAERDEVAA